MDDHRSLSHLSTTTPHGSRPPEIAEADALLAQGDVQAAFSALGSYLGRHHNNTDAMTRIASIHALSGNAHDAAHMYSLAAKVHHRHQRYDDAIRCCQVGLEVDGIHSSDRIGFWWFLGSCWESMDRPAEALRVYRVALGSEPTPHTFARRSRALQKIEARAHALEVQGVIAAPTGRSRSGADAAPPSASCIVPRSDIEHLRDYFQRAVGPQLRGPRDALECLAQCEVALEHTNAAIEAYEALLAQTRDDDKSPPLVSEIRARIAALRAQKEA